MSNLLTLSILLLLAACTSPQQGGSIQIDGVSVNQPDNAKTGASLNHESGNLQIEHADGDNLKLKVGDSLLTYKAHKGAKTTVERSSTVSDTGKSYKDFMQYFSAIGKQFRPLLYTGIGLMLLGVGLLAMKMLRPGITVTAGGGLLLAFYKLALSPYFAWIAVIFLIGAVVLYVLERKGILGSVGHGGEDENEAVTKARLERERRKKQKKKEHSDLLKELNQLSRA